MEKLLGGGEEDMEDRDMGEEGEPRTEDEGGGEVEVEEARRRSRSRRAVGRDSVWVWSHCSRRAVVGEQEEEGRRVGPGVAG